MATVTAKRPPAHRFVKPNFCAGLRSRARALARRFALGRGQRTGRYARDLTAQRARTWASQFWWGLLALVAAPPALAVPCSVLFLHGPLRYLVIGAVSASGLWLALLGCVVFSGAATTYVSVVAEQWTADTLRRLRRRGWRLINGFKLVDQADIDHVAVGPAGVLVVETKWSAEAWDLTQECGFGAHAVDRAVAQVANAAKLVYGSLGNARRGLAPRDALVRPVVVLHSSTGPASAPVAGWDQRRYEDWQVAVVHGSYLHQWLESLDGHVLGRPDVERLWTALDDKVRRYETRTGIAPRPTLAGLYFEWVIKPFAASAVAFLALCAVGSEHSRLVDFLSWCGAMFLGAAALRVKALRRLAVGWLPVWVFAFVVGDILIAIRWRS